MLIDPHKAYPPDFRCEKMEGGQVAILRRTGLIDTLLNMATHTDRVWIARFGRLLDIQPCDQYGFRYEDMVNAFRGAVPETVKRVHARVSKIDPGEGARRLLLSHGTAVEARPVILTNGLNRSLSRRLASASPKCGPPLQRV